MAKTETPWDKEEAKEFHKYLFNAKDGDVACCPGLTNKLFRRLVNAERVISDLMPFLLEDYENKDCMTAQYIKAVESAIRHHEAAKEADNAHD